jgi:methyl-accepting chemotaxis protein
MRRARFSVSLRFMLVLFIGIALQACISVGSLLALKQSQLSDRTSEVKHLLETAYSTVAFYESQARAGRLTDRAARTAAIDAVPTLSGRASGSSTRLTRGNIRSCRGWFPP